MIENAHYGLPVEELFVGAMTAQPIQVDEWDLRRLRRGNLHTAGSWSYWEAVDFEILNGTYPIVVHNGQRIRSIMDPNGVVADLSDIDAYLEENTIEGSFSEDWLLTLAAKKGVRKAQGPQMNYWYPLQGIYESPEVAAMALRDVALCVVEVEGEFGLALTGGGMDLSWDICSAFVRLGYLPPVHYADLPNMAGQSTDHYVLEAMLRALTVTAERATTSAALLREKFPPTSYEYEIQGKFAHGWEMVTTEATSEAAFEQLRTHRENDSSTVYRVKKVPASR